MGGRPVARISLYKERNRTLWKKKKSRASARINALAHKAKTSGLTEAELAERDALRQEYLADIRASMIDQLEHTTVIEPDGTRRKLQVRH